MEYVKLVPDVDDYDDDNSLASLFCLCCAALGRAHPCRGKQAAPADSSVFHKIYTRSLKRESISAQFFLSNNFRIIFRIRLMLKMNDDG